MIICYIMALGMAVWVSSLLASPILLKKDGCHLTGSHPFSLFHFAAAAAPVGAGGALFGIRTANTFLSAFFGFVYVSACRAKNGQQHKDSDHIDHVEFSFA